MLEKFVVQKKEIIDKIDNILKYYEKILELTDNDKTKEIFFKQSDRFSELEEKIKQEKITIGVMATVSNGKSTFLNALIFKKPILQAQSGETTATLFEIRYGDEYKINNEVVNSEDEIKAKIEEINHQTLKNIKNKQFSYEKITIELPFEKLKHIVLLDTPGYGSLNEMTMMKILEEASKKSDVIVLILDISQGLKKEDKIFLEKIKENNLVHKTFIVLNKLDAIMSEDDLILKSKEEIEKEINNVINTTKEEINKIIKTNHIYPLSAKKALVAKIQNDEDKLKESKFKEFEKIFWNEAIKLKDEKFEKEIKAFEEYKQRFCSSLKEEVEFQQNNLKCIKELINTTFTHEIASELEVLKLKKEKLERISFNFKLENQEVKEKLLDKLESDLRWELKNVGFFSSFSESAWKEAIEKGIKEFEKDFGEIFNNDYFNPLLIEIQNKIEEVNKIIEEINHSIENLNKDLKDEGKELKIFDEIKKDYEISPDGKFTYTSEEFVNFLEDLGFSVAAGAAGYGVGVVIELLAGRFITFAIPGIGWILGILAAGYTLFKQSNKWEEVLKMVLNEVKPQVLEAFTQKQIEVQNKLILKKNDEIQMRIGGIISTINEIEKVLTQKEEKKEKMEYELKQREQIVNKLNTIHSQICNKKA